MIKKYEKEMRVVFRYTFQFAQPAALWGRHLARSERPDV